MRAGQSLAHGFRQMIGAQAIPTPRVDPQLVRLSVIERSAEVVRYALWRAEHWLSPGGTLRAVLRLSVKLALLIGIPVLTVGPVVLLLLEGAAAASASLVMLAANLAAMSISFIIAILGFAVLTALVRRFRHRK
jgi:membrane glycosyltransferase